MPRATMGQVDRHTSKRMVSARIVAASLAATVPIRAVAQPPPAEVSVKAQAPAGPTTKLMAIGTRTANAKPDVIGELLPREISETVQLYLQGKIDQWFVKQDQTGVVFILNVTDTEQAKELLEQLPLGRAGLMTFEFISLGPLRPLALLLPKTRE